MTDECGAPELFSGGAKLMGVGGTACKLTPAAVTAMLGTLGRGEHEQRPSVVSLSEATELGTLYTPAEVAALAALAREHAACACTWTARASPTPWRGWAARRPSSPGRPAWTCCRSERPRTAPSGVEAVVFFDTALARDFVYLRKRTGQLVSKSRFLGAQMLAYLEDDRWLANARHANQMADRLAGRFGALPGVRLPLPVEANAVFAIVPQVAARAPAAAGRALSRVAG